MIGPLYDHPSHSRAGQSKTGSGGAKKIIAVRKVEAQVAKNSITEINSGRVREGGAAGGCGGKKSDSDRGVSGASASELR